MKKHKRKFRTAYKVHLSIFVLMVIFRAIIFMTVDPRPKWLDIFRLTYIFYLVGILFLVDKYENDSANDLKKEKGNTIF